MIHNAKRFPASAVRDSQCLWRHRNIRTAAQIKSENEEVVDSVGELVALCEKEGFIPRFYIDGPNDKVDKTIMDMQKYTHDLVTEELGLGNLIESAIQQIQKEREADEEIEANPTTFEDELFAYDADQTPITYEDYTEFEEFTESLAESDFENIYDELLGDDR